MNTSKPNFKLIIGLGNPGKKYEKTYHNVGQVFIDYLERQAAIGKRYVPLTILHSTSYMNESGSFAAKAIKKSGIKPEELLIVHDDSDIYLGDFKLSFGRGAAGHHGVENIQAILKTKNFWRLRIGIRPISPIGSISLIKPRRQKAEKFVLKKITSANKKILDQVFQKAARRSFYYISPN